MVISKVRLHGLSDLSKEKVREQMVITVDFTYYEHGYCGQPLIPDKLVGTEFLMDDV